MCKALYQKLIQKVGLDKIVHFLACLCITLVVGRFLHWGIAAGTAMVVGLIKEIMDKPFDKKDLLADAIGALLGLLILLI